MVNQFIKSDSNPLSDALKKAETNLSNLQREPASDATAQMRKIINAKAVIRAYRRMLNLVEQKSMPEVSNINGTF